MHAATGFWRAKIVSMFGAKFENGMVRNALETGLSFSLSTDGQTSYFPPGSGEGEFPYPVPGVPSGGKLRRVPPMQL